MLTACQQGLQKRERETYAEIGVPVRDYTMLIAPHASMDRHQVKERMTYRSERHMRYAGRASWP